MHGFMDLERNPENIRKGKRLWFTWFWYQIPDLGRSKVLTILPKGRLNQLALAAGKPADSIKIEITKQSASVVE